MRKMMSATIRNISREEIPNALELHIAREADCLLRRKQPEENALSHPFEVPRETFFGTLLYPCALGALYAQLCSIACDCRLRQSISSIRPPQSIAT